MLPNAPCALPQLTGLPFLLFAGLLGLLLGSFYGLCTVRLATGKSIVRPGSRCPHCRRPLRPWELVPVVSYVALRGRCAGCAHPISPAYPAIEVLSAVWAVLVARTVGPTPWFVGYMLLGGLFIVLSVIDLRTFRLPDALTYPAALVGIAIGAARPDVGPTSALLGAATGCGVFWLIATLYRLAKGTEGLGGGDIKLMVSIGGVVGLAGLANAVLLGSVAALCASPLFVRGHTPATAMPIPFGPFLCFGAMTQLLYGQDMLRLLLRV